MIERNLLDQTKDLRGPHRMLQPQRLVQSNFGMLTEEQRRIAEQGLSQNERVGRDRLARLPDLSHPALRQQFQGNNSANAQPIQGNNRPVFDVSGPIRAGGSGSMVMRPVPPDQMQDNNPSQTYQNQENRSFSNSYGNSYNNSMSGYQPQYGSRGGFGMQQPMYGGGMGIMGLQSPFGGYGGGMQQSMYGGMQQGYGMQSPYGGYGMQQPQYQSSPFSPQFGGGIGSMSPGMGGGYGQPPQCGGGYGQQPPSYGGEYGGYNTQRDYDQRPQTQPGPAMMLMPQMRTM
jgi:hypothetical protein